MPLQIISVADIDYRLQDIYMRDVLAIAKMPINFFERQLSQILTTIVGDTADPETKKSINVRHLTAEERYALFLNYLDLTRDQNDLNTNIVVSDFLSGELKDFSRERIFNENGVSIRHLNGIEVEALEMGCTDTNDWILGAMAITIGCDKLPPIDMPTSIEFCGRMIKSRMTLLEGLEKDEFNDLMAQYLMLQGDQVHLVNIAFDKGIVLERTSKRGTDDAPVRFRPEIAFTGYCKAILSNATRSNTAV